MKVRPDFGRGTLVLRPSIVDGPVDTSIVPA